MGVREEAGNHLAVTRPREAENLPAATLPKEAENLPEARPRPRADRVKINLKNINPAKLTHQGGETGEEINNLFHFNFPPQM
jgi:hypothetical protein